MKNMKKLLSAALSGVMALSILGGLTVNAEESAEEKKYKLSELMPMSQEEFFSLEDAEKIYNYCHQAFKRRDGLHLYSYDTFAANCRPGGMGITDKEYKPYYTEKEINDLLDAGFENGVNIRISSSPILRNTEDKNSKNIGNWFIFIGIDDKNYDGTHDVSDEEWILKFAKIDYCLSQVYPFVYHHCGITLSSTTIYGDANGDEKLTISDAAFIAKKIAGRKTGELSDTADINNDGKVNLKDSVYIARFMNAKHLAKAAGWMK